MAQNPGTNRQIPDHSIMDLMGKQCYLGNEFIYANSKASFAATTETPILLLSNPAVTASGFPSGYVSLFVNLNKLIVATASQNVIMRIYLNPAGITAGTSETPVNLRPQSPTTSIAALSINPTGTISGNPIQVLAAQIGLPDTSDVLMILDPGNSILITAQASATATAMVNELSWFEL
jgi:hypothetical protein